MYKATRDQINAAREEWYDRNISDGPMLSDGRGNLTLVGRYDPGAPKSPEVYTLLDYDGNLDDPAAVAGWGAVSGYSHNGPDMDDSETMSGGIVAHTLENAGYYTITQLEHMPDPDTMDYDYMPESCDPYPEGWRLWHHDL